MGFDVFWYNAATKARAYREINRLSDEERMARRLRCGLVLVDNAPMPGADGIATGEIGRCLATNYYGVRSIPFGAVKHDDRRIIVTADLSLEELEPGLIGGTWKSEFWERPEVKREIEQQRATDEVALAGLLERKGEEYEAVAVNAAHRLWLTVARVEGVPAPEKLDEQALHDLYIYAGILKRIPTLEEWFQRLGIQGQAAPAALDPVEDEEAFMLSARSAAVRTKNVKGGQR